MATHIALLRGVNVGGHNKLPMADLRSLLTAMGLDNVKTYIQSGNAVFSGDLVDRSAWAARISGAIEASHGFAPRVLLLGADEVEQAMADNPFPAGEAEPKTLHLYFLAATPADPDLEKLEAVAGANERFHLGDGVFYLYAPEGIGRSKLAAEVEGALGVPVTARNWRSVSKIMELARQIDVDAE